MSQLSIMKSLIGAVPESDAVLQFYLDAARDVICNLRDSYEVEPQYLNVQIEMAIELFNKRGAEGQIAHNENGIDRTYEKAHISESLLAKVTPMVRSPFSKVRVI